MIVTTLENLQIYDEEIKNYIKKALDENSEQVIVVEDSFLKFPVVGNNHTIYIDTTENTIYRFSETDLKYYSVVSDWTNIKTINASF